MEREGFDKYRCAHNRYLFVGKPTNITVILCYTIIARVLLIYSSITP
jgi:hypothetical protein